MSRFAVLFATAALALGWAAPASAITLGDEGCTPGYWKNHPENWLEDDDGTPSYDPDELFGDVFGVDYDVTLLDALQGGGGSGISGARRILARAATAALLNAAHDGLGYPLSRYFDTEDGGAILYSVAEVWDSGDRAAIIELAGIYDEFNNLGCPL